VDYTQAVATNDQAKKTAAVTNLVSYCDDFGAFLASYTGGRMTKDQVSALIKTHVASLKEIVDAQAAKDYASAYTKERDAEKHMLVLGNDLADAIVEQFPSQY
jgi:hypothetical protein